MGGQVTYEHLCMQNPCLEITFGVFMKEKRFLLVGSISFLGYSSPPSFLLLFSFFLSSMNIPPFPNYPHGRKQDIIDSLSGLKLRVGGNADTVWRRLISFVALCPKDPGILTEIPADIVATIFQFLTADVEPLIASQISRAEAIEILQNRITKAEMKTELRRRAGLESGTRDHLLARLLAVFRGNPILPGEVVTAEVRTLVEYAHGTFIAADFINPPRKIKRGQQVKEFDMQVIRNGFQQNPALPICMEGGVHHGHRLPSLQEAARVYQLVTWNEGGLLANEMEDWVFTVLGSSDYFNNLLGAFDTFASYPMNAPLPACPLCNQHPCMALDRSAIPLWITKMREGVTPQNARAQR